MALRKRRWPKIDGQHHVLAVLNQKGGVGKSTTVVNLAAALAEAKARVLVVDFDPQGNTTSGFGVDADEIASDIYSVLLQETPVQDAVVSRQEAGVDLLPATTALAGAEIELVDVKNREGALKKALAPITDNYDYILIDCPPSLGLLTLNALAAADGVLIPIQCEYYALEGVSSLLETLKLVQKSINPALEIFGVLMTMYDRRTLLSKQVVTEVSDYFGDKMFKEKIPRSVKVSEAPSYGEPVTQYARANKGAQAYLNLAKEVIQRG